MILFENFNEIHKICQEYGITNYTINSDGTIDVDWDVHLSFKNLRKLPLKFRNVSRYFYCSDNNLTTLEGAPQSVSGDFYCYHNELTTLEGAPQSVEGHFACDNNMLTTLEGAPLSISGHFACDNNMLTTLVGAPKSVGGNFFCGNNPFEIIEYMFPNGKEFLNANNYWEFFDGGNKIRKLRFKEALLDYNIELPESISGYEYI
jgi:hypothetical protein